MKTLEVRCCCTPMKLLGWLAVPDENHQSIEISTISAPSRTPPDRDTSAPLQPVRKVIRLEIATVAVPVFDSDLNEHCPMKKYRAIKAEGMTVETLRLIPGFIENDPAMMTVEQQRCMRQIAKRHAERRLFEP